MPHSRFARILGVLHYILGVLAFIFFTGLSTTLSFGPILISLISITLLAAPIVLSIITIVFLSPPSVPESFQSGTPTHPGPTSL
jgi:hypothetical protein